MFSQSESITGINLRRNYSVDPTYTPYNGLSQTLTLTSQSQVEIYRDGQLIARREMAPGVYDISNLPIAAFAGQLQIKIRDVYGATQIIDIPFRISQQNLKAGVDDFNLAAGPQRRGKWIDGLAAGGYYRYGITDNITLSAALSNKAAADITYSSPIGIWTAGHTLDMSDNYHLIWSYSTNDYSGGASYTRLQGQPQNLSAQAALPLKTLGIEIPALGITFVHVLC